MDAQPRYPVLPFVVSQHGVSEKNTHKPQLEKRNRSNDTARTEWRRAARNHLDEERYGEIQVAFALPSHAEAESRAQALAACSLRLVAPGGLCLRASRRCTWRRAGVETGSGDDDNKGPVARNTRRELDADADARCHQAMAVGGER